MRSDSEGIQTLDLQNRNLTLYSAKLRSQLIKSGAKIRHFFQTAKYSCEKTPYLCRQGQGQQDKGGSYSTSGQIEAEGLHQPAHSSILLDQLVERLLGREQRLDLLLLGQTDGDLQTAVLQAFGQRGTDAALDGQHLVVENLILRHDLHVGIVSDDRTEVSHSRGHSPHVLWHTGAHRAPLDEEILLREGVALFGILHLHRLLRRGFILVG